VRALDATCRSIRHHDEIVAVANEMPFDLRDIGWQKTIPMMA
jgi:hypothetical protein